MDIYIKIFEVIFPVFFVIGVGYYLGKKNPKIDNLIISNVMICDDLYSFLKSSEKAELERKNVKENSISKDLKKILSELDQNEFIFQNDDNFISKLIMVCGRSEKKNLSKNEMKEINRRLVNKRLLSLANSYLENLRQEARIVLNE